jgi:phosphoglycolate phosphatase
LPKADLHNHLNGSVPVEVIADLVRKYKIKLPDWFDIDFDLQVLKPVSSLRDYFRPWFALKKLPVGRECLRQMLQAVFSSLTADNVKYVELRTSPFHIAEINQIPLDESLNWLVCGIRECSDRYGIRGKLIISFSRYGFDLDRSYKLLRAIFRDVHQRYHDSEQPVALLETRTVMEYFEGRSRREIAQVLNPAFRAFDCAREEHLKLHSGVEPALAYICRRGVKLVAHTDSQLFGAIDRLTRLSLADYFSRVYCRERSEPRHPNPEAGRKWLSRFPMHKVRELSRHQMKPDPTVLSEICGTEGVTLDQAAYVGDSIARDILMAKRAGLFSIWAKYGAILHTEEYERLVRITHWTKEDVERERELRRDAEKLEPDFVAEHSFAEILIALFPSELTGVLSS